MSETTVWRKENGVRHTCNAVHGDLFRGVNKFTKAATAFMDHVHLLNEARDAYQLRLPLAHPFAIVSTQATGAAISNDADGASGQRTIWVRPSRQEEAGSR